MCKTSRHQASRRHALAAGTALVAGLGALAGACGGSDDGPAEPAPVVAYRLAPDVTPTARWVQLEGCVVDESFIPRTGIPVQALAADGRLVGAASSDMDGLFRVQVPAHAPVSVRIDRPGGESLVVVTGRNNLSASACLRDPPA